MFAVHGASHLRTIKKCSRETTEPVVAGKLTTVNTLLETLRVGLYALIRPLSNQVDTP